MQDHLQALLDAALEDGGWSWGPAGTEPDVDTTAMAIQALAPYYQSDTNVRGAVDSALAVLRGIQLPGGGFAYNAADPPSTESTAQVIVALSALGVNPTSWETTGGQNPVTALLLNYNGEGAWFGTAGNATESQMSTEQAAYALVAYDRLLQGKSPLYAMADAFNTTDPGTDPDPVILTSLSLTSPPAKASYTAGEEFDPAGLVVQAHFSDSSTAVLAGDVFTLSTGAGEFLQELAKGSVLSQAGDITVTVTYTQGGVTQTTTFVLTVNPAPAPNAENLARVQAATELLANLASLAQVSQATANDANTVLAWIQAEVEALALDGVGTTVSVNVNSAVAGTAGNPSGINGSFAATLTLSAGAGETLATATLSRTGTILASAYTAPADRIHASISVEKLSLDGNFIIEPALLELDEGSTAAEALMALLEATGVNSRYDGKADRDDFYLRSVGLESYQGNPSVEGSPHYPGYLSEFDEGDLSGWMITVNNSFIGTGAGARALADGDVVRWQYTCTPGDVGGSAQAPLGESTLASKDALIQKMAGINFDGKESFYGSAYTDALAVLQDLAATPEAIVSSLAALLALETIETPTVPEPGERILVSIAVSGLYRTSYTRGEALDLAGLVLIAHYSDGSSAALTGWTSDIADGTALDTPGKHFITLSYAEGEVTKTVRISVSVSELVGGTPVLPSPAAVQAALDKTLAYERQATSIDAYGYGAEWVVFGLARAGQMNPDIRTAYLEHLASYTVSVNGRFDRYTDYSRVILALSSLGVDARNFAGFDLTSYLQEREKVAAQGINGPIFALLALDSQGYGTLSDRAHYQAAILAGALPAGGWSLLGSGAADPDVTAMALQALAPYYHTGNAALDAAVDGALAALSALQQAGGGFSSWGTTNSESCAQVIVALNALGIGLDDARFVKDGKTIYDAFIAYQLASGAFEHAQGGGTN
ncbi:MAG: bacterial Ig-like domain-containing protein, partial [Coriobacteriales bacterium]|nr:bacterial Ig-like domain-containing protein [Coriobacteriales bacterium]